jgi:hypothetical protein
MYALVAGRRTNRCERCAGQARRRPGCPGHPARHARLADRATQSSPARRVRHRGVPVTGSPRPGPASNRVHPGPVSTAPRIVRQHSFVAYEGGEAAPGRRARCRGRHPRGNLRPGARRMPRPRPDFTRSLAHGHGADNARCRGRGLVSGSAGSADGRLRIQAPPAGSRLRGRPLSIHCSTRRSATRPTPDDAASTARMDRVTALPQPNNGQWLPWVMKPLERLSFIVDGFHASRWPLRCSRARS